MIPVKEYLQESLCYEVMVKDKDRIIERKRLKIERMGEDLKCKYKEKKIRIKLNLKRKIF